MQQHTDKPLWRRILDYPLVAMVLAIVIVVLCFTVAMLVAQFLVPPIPGFTIPMKFDLVSIPILLLAYYFVISRMGEHPHNDYRDRQWAYRADGRGGDMLELFFTDAIGMPAEMVAGMKAAPFWEAMAAGPFCRPNGL